MRTAALALILSFLPAAPADEPKPAAGQQPFTEDEVYTTVAKLGPDQGNWIAHDDVVVDHEGYVWLRAEAKVQSQKMALLAAKGGDLVLVRRDAKGLAITIGAAAQWEIVQRSTLKAADVLPCMTWRKGPPDAGPKKLKGGLQQ